MKDRYLFVREPFSRKLFNAANFIFFTLVVITMLLPLWTTFVTSISTRMESMEVGIRLWPSVVSLDGYREMWVNVSLWRPFVNNVFVAVVGTFCHVSVCVMAGYALNSEKTPFRKNFTTFFLLTMMIPSQLIIIPIYLVFKNLGLINSLWALIIDGLASAFSILLMRNYFSTIPRSLEESAVTDGAGEFKIFYRIFLPLSKPGIATITLFQFVAKWNHFMSAVLYIHKPEKYTLQLALKSLVVDSTVTSTTASIAENARTAGIIIAIIPLILIYPFAQRYFIKGITLGSVKE